jgi:hypothetical protein
MFGLNWKSLAVSSAISLSTTTTAFAQVTPLQISQASSFNCGPHLSTYVVKSLGQISGQGIRCVKFSQGRPGNSRIPRLAWYGEGKWNRATYRHVGHAFYNSSNLIGYASDISGNGESFNNNFPGNLQMQIINNGDKIRVTGGWNEEWKLVSSTNYNPLSRPRTCGRYFDQYTVSDLTGSRQGSGLRCVLREGRKNTTWFGNGNWGGSNYAHIGTRSSNGYGASDICATSIGSICNTFAWGSLLLTPVATRGFDVTGAWSEKWR